MAAIVGGVGIAPGANINYETGHAIFEATQELLQNMQDKIKLTLVQSSSSGAMMLEHLGWIEAAELIYKGLECAIVGKRVTYDFERLMEGATLLKCSNLKRIIQYVGFQIIFLIIIGLSFLFSQKLKRLRHFSFITFHLFILAVQGNL